MTNCPCDTFIFPPDLSIPAGLTTVPRQLATFPEFRSALLHAVGSRPALVHWRARSQDDFGVMLLEMWAYICDSVSFYDEVIAHESYLATARLRPSIRKLVGLLGYIPRPAAAGLANLAAIADGRKSVILPASVAFRSGAFEGRPPQVFELAREHVIHPFFNEWTLKPIRPETIRGTWTFLLLQTSNLAAKKDDTLLLAVGQNPKLITITSLDSHTGKDQQLYKKAGLSRSVNFGSGVRLSEVSLLKPNLTAGLWQSPTGADAAIVFLRLRRFGAITGPRLFVRLDGLYSQVRRGSLVLLSKGSEYRWHRVLQVSLASVEIASETTNTVTDANGNVTTINSPAVQTHVTELGLDESLAASGRSSIEGAQSWSVDDATEITVHFGLMEAAVVTVEAKTTLDKSDPLTVEGILELPASPPAPSIFHMEDRNGEGVEITGTLNFATNALSIDQTVEWNTALAVPVKMYGNIVSGTRGETVEGEVLGTGDGAASNQTFELKKSPLTYAPSPVAGNESGVASTLSVYVGGLRWLEVKTFFGAAPDDQVYIVRQDDQAETTVTFGDGKRGSRLPSGATVVAYYRFGAGLASPPAGSITQIAKGTTGLRSVQNPVGSVAGNDAEDAANIRIYAPRSALLLGRAVSIQDFEAATAGQGVRAVSAEWRWNQQRQRPVVQIWYIGAAGKEQPIAQTLRGLADPSTPIAVNRAEPLVRTLALDIAIDDRHLETDVVDALHDALMNSGSGPLAPERIGIGRPLYRSRIFEKVLAVPGAFAVRAASIDGNALVEYGITPGAGRYFDFETGGLLLNGKALHG